MENIFSFPKLVQHMKMEIPNNIKIGDMEKKIMSGVSDTLLKKTIPQLKAEFLQNHKDILNTQEKIDHVQMVLDKILARKYDFAKQNIEEGEKFNQFYRETAEHQIELPHQERSFECIHCKARSFKTNASLHSHYRSCTQKKDEKEHEDIEDIDDLEEYSVKKERQQGFKPIKVKGPKNETKPVKVFAAEVIMKQEEVKREEVKKDELKGKRQRPNSSYSLGSDIFYEE